MRLIQSQIDATCPLTRINLPQTWGKLSQMKYKKPNLEIYNTFSSNARVCKAGQGKSSHYNKQSVDIIRD